MVVCVALALGPGIAGAQCCGDCDGDREVTVSELIAAVNNALLDCQEETSTPAPTGTPTATATEEPTETPPRFVDNLDGTVSDVATGLMWEKKIGRDEAVDGFELHDADNRYPWGANCSGSEGVRCRTDADCPPQQICNASDKQRTDLTIFIWVDEVNREGGTGFAGYADWRVPTVEELRTLRASTEAPPMTGSAFNAAGCGTACMSLADPACSCTSPDPYWTTTPYEPNPQWAWRVDFAHGDVLPNPTKDWLRVRAVRIP